MQNDPNLYITAVFGLFSTIIPFNSLREWAHSSAPVVE